MNTIMYALMIFILVCIALMWYILTYNKYQAYFIRISEAETNIDSTLRKRFDLLTKMAAILKATLAMEELLPGLEELRSKKLTNFDLDRELYKSINEIHALLETHPDLKTNEEILKILISLTETEIEISALRKYYNNIITDYNKLVRTFPSNIVGTISHNKIRTYFDGKDMEDEIKNDFKL